jgi:hypothetical protein
MVNGPENQEPEHQNDPDNPTADVEQYLARIADPQRQQEYDEYVELVARERSEAIRSFIQEEILENALTHRSFNSLDVLPILDSDGQLSRPIEELMENRLNCFRRISASVAFLDRRNEDSNLSAGERYTNLTITRLYNIYLENYFTDYVLLHYVANYMHGWRNSKSERLKKMDQVQTIDETDESTPQGRTSRRRRLRALDILMPDVNGYDFENPLTDDELADFSEEVAHRHEHSINEQVRNDIRALLVSADLEFVETEVPFTHYRNHDDFNEFIDLIIMSVTDASGELLVLYEERINNYAQNMGIPENYVWDEIHRLRVTAIILRQWIAESDE